MMGGASRAALLALLLGAASAGDPTKPHPHQGFEAPFTPGVAPKLTGKSIAELKKGKAVFSQDRSGLSARVVCVQDVAAPAGIVWDRILDFNNYDKFVPLVTDCEVTERGPLGRGGAGRPSSQSSMSEGGASQQAVALPWWASMPVPGLTAATAAVQQPYEVGGAAMLRTPRGVTRADLEASTQRLFDNARAGARALAQRASRLGAAVQMPGRGRFAAVEPGAGGEPKRPVPEIGRNNEEIMVRLQLKLGVVKVTNYLTHQFYPRLNSLTWTLDYDKRSDFVENVGHWHVVELPTGNTRVFYSCVPHLPTFVPKPLVDLVANNGLKMATTWVKRESEKAWAEE
eukprot:CAMPEP_0118855916 /NCGR_PEP_ID=MMETSP1163-20130328/3570_1 /TAXON_ID=124430 /ORGANISM="Phaeomonas parva, Strain CCMP2877" /LENGTH=342 /DNA_ID=CAMNT_0006788897 /DNA_START=179 /DNA_END=1207 /DNA_ORIENTATION=-